MKLFNIKPDKKNSIDFLCIGAPRSGTTWLYSKLIQHPEIFLPPIKELHYFDGLQRNSNQALPDNNVLKRLFNQKQNNIKWRVHSKYLLRRLLTGKWDSKTNWYFKYLFTRHYNNQWYRSLFLQNEGKISGEITPAYSILDSEQIHDIKKINPSVKIIYALRNPVERTWSSVRKRIRKYQLNLNQAEILDLIIHDKAIKKRSAYYQNLLNYYKHFNRDQILITFFDELVENPKSYLKRITNFLEVKEMDYPRLDLTKKVNASPLKSMSPQIRKVLVEKHLDHLQNLKILVNAKTIDHWILNLTETIK